MTGFVEHGEVPGMVTLLSRRGETHVDWIGSKAFGGADPVERDTIFRISSMTKPITAAATMVLIEESTLRLDEPVDRLLPEIADRRVLEQPEGGLDQTVPAQRPITVRDLLTFLLGIGVVLGTPGRTPIQRAMNELHLGQGPPRPAGVPEPNEWIRRLGTLPLVHQPGERWMYNTGSDVLGVLIERASGQRFEIFLRERLFEPLGMRDTSFSVPASELGRLATCYWALPDPITGGIGVYDEPVGGQWSRPPAFASGAAGLVSTADDYLAFAKMLLNGGVHDAERVLSRASVELMTTDHLSSRQKEESAALVPGYFETHGWGLGLSVVTRREGFESVGTFGWGGGLGTSWYSDPREEMVGILMTQRAWASPRPPDVCVDFWTAAYRAIED
jgi:CubicO group peptidase (beta-lactamase class C family)